MYLERSHSRELILLAVLPLTAFPAHGAASSGFVPANLGYLVLGTYFLNSSLKIRAYQQMRLIASVLRCWLFTAVL